MTTIDPSPENAPPDRRQRQTLTAFALRLMEPAAALPESVRRQARLLSGLLLSLLLLIVLGIGALYLAVAPNNPLPGLTFPITVFGTFLLAAAYLLNQSGHYTTAASLTVAVTALGVWAAVLSTRIDFINNPSVILYVLLSVLLGSLLLSPRATAILAAAHLAGILLAPIFVPGFGLSTLINSLLFVSFTALVIVVGASLRQRGQAQLEAQTRALHDSELRFRALFAASPDAVLLIDPNDPGVDWPIIDCNDAACRMNGYTRQELLGHSIDILNASPGTPQERANYLEHLRREKTPLVAAQHKRKDGSLFSIESATSLITLAGRELILGIDRDITERKRAEETLRESDARFRALFEDAPVSLWEDDFSGIRRYFDELRAKGVTELRAYLADHPQAVNECMARIRVIDVNRKTLELFQAPSKAVLLENLGRVFRDDMRIHFQTQLQDLWAGLRAHEVEGVNYALTGDQVNIQLHWALMPGSETTFEHVLVSIEDISQRVRAGREIMRQKQYFEAVVDNSPVAIVVLDIDQRIVSSNPAFEKLFGYTSSEIVGRDLDSLVTTPGLHAEAAAYTQQAIAGGVAHGVGQRRRQDGTLVDVEIFGVPVTAGGEQIGTLGLYHDITERRRAEEELTESNAKLTAWLGELEERAREMAMLNDLVSLFQTCRTAEEAYIVVGKMAPALFPGAGGALCIIHPSHNLVETMATWGEPNYSVSVFQMDDCWALRRAQPHLVLDGQSGLICRHLAGTPPAYICVPLFVQTDVLGCLNINTPAGQLADRTQQLAKTVADAIALSLANLRLRESLRQQSIIDVLTGLFNRRYMEETLEREVRRCARAQRPLSVIMLDLDHFKSFNDAHGHAAGDVLLGELGSFLRSHVRVEDIACRYGGEEFTLILPDSSLGATAQRAELLRVGIQSLRVEFGGRLIGPVTISLGIAAFPEHGADGAVVLRSADEALYRAKREGRNRIVVAGSSSILESATSEHGLEGASSS